MNWWIRFFFSEVINFMTTHCSSLLFRVILIKCQDASFNKVLVVRGEMNIWVSFLAAVCKKWYEHLAKRNVECKNVLQTEIYQRDEKGGGTLNSRRNAKCYCMYANAFVLPILDAKMKYIWCPQRWNIKIK